MLEAIGHFLNSSGYLPHGFCINWSQPLLLSFVISDLLIFLAYSSMPLALGYFILRRKNFPYPWILGLFATFIMTCGLTHLMGAVLLWWPLYGLDALLKAITAIVSVFTAITLWPLIPQMLNLPNPSQLQQVNQALQAEISERKRIEEALRLAKETAEQGLLNERKIFAAIVEFSEDAIVGITLDGNISSWNQAAERMYGYRSDEILGHTIYDLIPEPYRATEKSMLAAIRRGEVIQHYETERLHKDGSLVTVSITISPIRDKDGHVVGASKIARDISERKRAEKEIHHLNTHLERRVAERTAELIAANRELDSFAYAVSHDLRAPLRAMNGFSLALIEDYGQQIPEAAQLYLQQIGIAAHKMNDLVEGLLVLSRSTRGDMYQDVIDLSALAERLLDELRLNEPQRQLDAQIDTGLSVRGDPRMIEVMLRNLLENAWKYTAHTAKAYIRVYKEFQHNTNKFCVADNGAGFDMAHTNRLFQPFQRLHRQEEFPGIGIGLATVERIIHRHGGSIEARGEPGSGAVFCFTLPDNATGTLPDTRQTS